MKILIAIGMVIIFISAFFILFILDSMIKNQTICAPGQESSPCDQGQFGRTTLISLAFIASFLIVDAMTLYLIIKSIMDSGYSYIAYNA